MDAMGKGKGLAVVALVVLISAFAYSYGVQQGAEAARQQWGEMPVDPKTVMLMRDAANRARSEGDGTAAEWFDAVAKNQMEQMVSWATRSRSARPAARGD